MSQYRRESSERREFWTKGSSEERHAEHVGYHMLTSQLVSLVRLANKRELVETSSFAIIISCIQNLKVHLCQ